MIEHPPSRSGELPGSSVLARSVCADFDVVGVVSGGGLAFVNVDNPLDKRRRKRVRVGHGNVVSAFQHAGITRHYATFSEGAILHKVSD